MMQNMLPERNETVLEKAIDRAAKMICALKWGCCPMQEPNFPGCPCVCNEDIVPWQCWAAYLRATAA